MKNLLFVLVVGLGMWACTQNTTEETAKQENANPDAPNTALLKNQNYASHSPSADLPENEQNANNYAENQQDNNANNSNTTVLQAGYSTAQIEKASKDLSIFLKKYAPKSTFTKIDPRYNQAVIGKNGVACVFPAGCFSSSDSVSIELVEYAKPTEFLLAGIGTMADNDMLQTGGSVYIKATVNGQVVEPSKPHILSFQRGKEEFQDMRIFNGQIQDNQQVNWELEKGVLLLQNREVQEIIGEVVTSREAKLGKQAYLTELYEDNSNKNSLVNFRRANPFMSPSEEVFFNFFKELIGGEAKYNLDKIEVVSDQDGNFEAVYTFQDGKLDKNEVNQMLDGYLKKHKQKGKGIRANSRMVFRIQEAPPYPISEIVDITPIIRKILIQSYVYQSKLMNWINCDRFIDVKDEDRTNIMVTLPQNLKSASAQLYFPAVDGFIPMQFSTQIQWEAQRIPMNYNAKIVIFGIDENDKKVMAVQDIRTDKKSFSVEKTESFSHDKLIKLLDKKKA